MSEQPETPAADEAEGTEASTEEEEAPDNRAARRGGRVSNSALEGVFSQASDKAARPGFRNVSNARSKAQKGKKGKKGKKGRRR